MKPETPLSRSLADLLDRPQAVVEDLDRVCIDVSSNEVRQAAAVWLALLGLANDSSAAAEVARCEVAGDRALVVALHRPASELLSWWRGAAWCDFTRSDSEGDAWAWTLCDRLRAVRRQLGPMASQVPVTPEMVWKACSAM